MRRTASWCDHAPAVLIPSHPAPQAVKLASVIMIRSGSRLIVGQKEVSKKCLATTAARRWQDLR